MEIIVVKDYAALSRCAARIVIAELTRNPSFVLGCATGGTPIGLYQLLSNAYKRRKIDFRRVRTFNLDEYVDLSISDPNSYHTFMEEHLFRGTNLKRRNTFFPTPTRTGCASYERTIRASGGIDLLILGIGQNGHIGFNEPGSSFASRTRVVQLTASTRRANTRFFKNLAAVPRQAVTMGLATIMEAKNILLLASGKTKRRVLRAALSERSTTRIPASILQRHPSVTVICDHTAAPL